MMLAFYMGLGSIAGNLICYGMFRRDWLRGLLVGLIAFVLIMVCGAFGWIK